MRYRVTRYHKVDNTEYPAGQILEISDADFAAWLNRDMRGGLVPVTDAPVAPVVEAQTAEQPAHDRMVRKAQKRTEDPNAMIDKTVFKAVRNKGD